jgi:hypothetical protein
MRRKFRGLSLLELTISIVVAALVIFSLFQLITSGLRYQAQSRISAKLTWLTQSALEMTRMEAFSYARAGSPLPATPSARRTFPAPDSEFGYRVTYYDYKSFEYPPHITILLIPVSWPDPDKTMYLIAIHIIVDGPVGAGSVKQTGYKSVQVVSLMHYPVYKSASPPTSNVMPASLRPASNPDIPIPMP